WHTKPLYLRITARKGGAISALFYFEATNRFSTLFIYEALRIAALNFRKFRKFYKNIRLAVLAAISFSIMPRCNCLGCDGAGIPFRTWIFREKSRKD
ncbi:MAG: hypothetical protein LBS85_07420, partial [Clostridiales Family XIII bacterium]|nr:hypothetical protein [Clostridiales Family XIII bacterium]